MLRAVLFDLDGTLLDTEFQYTHFWDEVGHEYLPDAVDFAKKIKGLTLKQIYEDYFDSSSICACISSRLELFEQAMVYKFIPHSISFIQDLRRHGIKCAVITSSNDAKMACVRRAIPDFDKYFDAVLVSGDFEFSKPHPDCFIKGCNRLGVNFEECIIFEDALAGLEAGYRSSIMTVGVEGTCRQEEMMSYCDVVISSFANKDYKWAEDLLNKRRYISDKERVVLEYLDSHSIEYSVYRHPEGKTIEEAQRWWHDDGSLHCKNIFLRNHKGDQHYLVSFSCSQDLSIHGLENTLKVELQSAGYNSPGKLSFASSSRLQKYLDVVAGSVSPFGLINDKTGHVILFLDENIRLYRYLSFHPNDCRSTVVISLEAFERYLSFIGNTYRYMKLYE